MIEDLNDVISEGDEILLEIRGKLESFKKRNDPPPPPPIRYIPPPIASIRAKGSIFPDKSPAIDTPSEGLTPYVPRQTRTFTREEKERFIRQMKLGYRI